MGAGIKGAYGPKHLQNLVIVNSYRDLQGPLDSAKTYFLDGIIDMKGVSIEVPAGGLTLSGYTFDNSKLTDSTEDYTMFVSPVGGSGNLLGMDYAVEVTGVNAQVYDIFSVTGFEAFEFSRINYNDCTSLGKITNYRQGLELGTGRFGGSPSLTLDGEWVGGYRITTSIVRQLDNAIAEPLFKAGPTFTMASRFLTDINADLGTLAPLLDFEPANFPNASTLQLNGCIITRNGVVNPGDATILPNVDNTDLASVFRDNIGVNNTFEGGDLRSTVEVTTTINTIDVYEDLAATWTASSLQHFDSPANGHIRHIGDSPRDYKVDVDLSVSGTAAEVVEIKISKWDDSASSFVSVSTQQRQMNALLPIGGGRDVAFFNLSANTTLDTNDFVKIEVRNKTSTNDVLAELDSLVAVETR
jgi:hypothetical protein